MLTIAFVNMPFAAVELPSLALTQLKALLDERFSEQCLSQIYYPSHDFAHFLGIDLYQSISMSGKHHNTGLGDWFFRQAAFPELPDNSKDYFNRYYPSLTSEELKTFKTVLLEKRSLVENLLDDLIDKYALDKADIVGCTSMFMQNVACLALARKIKLRNPATLIVMGGANCEAPMGRELVQQTKAIDFVFSGPALISFLDFIQYYLQDDLTKCHAIPGVFSKRNAILKNAHDMIGRELDINEKVPLNYEPFLDIIETHFSEHDIEPILLFETSRGCWWGQRAHCTFCGLNGSTMNYRAMKADRAIAQFNDLFQYASRCAHFNCVDNIIPKNYFIDVFPKLDVPEHISIFYEIKADLPENELHILADTHINRIQPGIESLSTSVLKLMRKGTSAFQNIILLKNCITYDVYPVWNLLIGFPGEDEAVYAKYVLDLPLLTHLPPPSGVFPVRFDRYSPYFMQSTEYNLDLHPADYYFMIYPFKEEVLSQIAYYFVNYNYEARYFVTMADWIDKVAAKFQLWHHLWQEGVNAVSPMLFLKPETSTIYDSRTGEPSEYPVPESVAKLLYHLVQPRRVADLKELDEAFQSTMEKDLSFLREKGLVFEENERLISLVFLNEPASMRTVSASIKPHEHRHEQGEYRPFYRRR